MKGRIRLRHDERGFTLIELLVVILIIAILAAIAIAIFVGQSSKAFSADAKETLHSAQTAMETYGIDHGSVCGATVSDLTAIDPSLAGANVLSVSTCGGGDKTEYSVTDTSRATPPVSFGLEVDHSVTTRTCSPTGENGCTGGTW